MEDHAALLRRAATKARETAQAATEGGWAIWDDLNDQGYITVGDEQGVLTEERPSTEECNPVAKVYTRDDADHIALWHPGVALAVAEWLEHEAGVAQDGQNRATLLGHRLEYPHEVLEAVNVARVLLNEPKEA